MVSLTQELAISGSKWPNYHSYTSYITHQWIIIWPIWYSKGLISHTNRPFSHIDGQYISVKGQSHTLTLTTPNSTRSTSHNKRLISHWNGKNITVTNRIISYYNGWYNTVKGHSHTTMDNVSLTVHWANLKHKR